MLLLPTLVGCAGGTLVIAEVAVVVTPDDPASGYDDLACAAPGAASPSFRWTADGVEVATGSVLPADRTRLGRVLRCEVTDGGATGATEVTPRAAGGNVLLLVVDDLGREKLAVEGVGPGPFPRTPNLDALAAESLRFENAWSMPVCSSTRATVMTGRLPRQHGIGDVLVPRDPYPLPDEEVFLPQVLAAAPDPVRSRLVGKWHLNVRHVGSAEAQPLHAGFERWQGTNGNLQTAFADTRGGLGYADWEYDVDGELTHVVGEYATEYLVRDAVGALAELEPPWFLMVALHAPHDPFHLPPPEWRYTEPTSSEPDKRERLDLMIESADVAVGQILDAMSEEQRQTTTVLLVSDNGTMYTVAEAPFDQDHAKGTPYQGGVNVPFWVSGPLVAEPGAVSEALVSTVDLFDTVLAVAGVLPHEVDALVGREEHVRHGTSFLPYLSDAARPSIRAFGYTEKLVPNGPPPWRVLAQGIRDERYKLVKNAREGDATVVELFDLGSDPFEKADLLAGPLDPDAQSAYDTLLAELARLDQELVYEY